MMTWFLSSSSRSPAPLSSYIVLNVCPPVLRTCLAGFLSSLSPIVSRAGDGTIYIYSSNNVGLPVEFHSVLPMGMVNSMGVYKFTSRFTEWVGRFTFIWVGHKIVKWPILLQGVQVRLCEFIKLVHRFSDKLSISRSSQPQKSHINRRARVGWFWLPRTGGIFA